MILEGRRGEGDPGVQEGFPSSKVNRQVGSREGDATVGLSGRLARQSIKMVKAGRRTGWGVVEGVPKTAPKGVVFCRLFTGTSLHAVSLQCVWSAHGRTELQGSIARSP